MFGMTPVNFVMNNNNNNLLIICKQIHIEDNNISYSEQVITIRQTLYTT